MDFIPFRDEKHKIFLQNFLPEVRIFTAFLFALPCPFISSVLLIFSILIVVLIIGIIGGIRIKKILKRWVQVIPVMLILVIFLPFFSGITELWSFYIGGWKIVIYLDRIQFALRLILVMNTMFFSFMIFFSSLSFTEFSHVRIIPSMFRSTLVLMLRYIPLFFYQNKKISEAQLLRGKKEIRGISARARNFGYMLGTTIVKSLEQSTRTYESLKLRGFGGTIPISGRSLNYKDIIFMIFCCIIISILIYIGSVYFIF
ncbi:MAG: energy-coupling factor transporter transmembrane component T family protein [Candidatus Helarchaeota archaeon]